mgnify:CR=1 FL=1
MSEILTKSTIDLAKETGIKTVVLAGGVSANSELRQMMKDVCQNEGFSLYYPELCYCGDNAAMIGSQAYFEYLSSNTAGMELNAYATKSILGEAL